MTNTARQNVTTPSIHCDYYQYARAVGQYPNEGIGDFLGAVSDGDGSGPQNMMLHQEASKLNDVSKMFYLNPIRTGNISFNIPHDTTHLTTKYNLGKDAVNSLFLLNHNLGSQGVSFDVNQIDDQGNEIDEGLMIQETNAINYNSGGALVYDGWSKVELDSYFEPAATNLKLSFVNTNNPWSLIIGAISYGMIFDFPHSPNLNLSMRKEYDVSQQTTINGQSIRHINWSMPPKWSSGEPWGLHEGLEDAFLRRSGRRIWDLTFSHISDSDMMADYEMLNFNNLPEGHGYEDFLETSAFFPLFMQYTMGGNLPFIFMPQGRSELNLDNYAICILDQKSINITQSSFQTYDIKLRIKEVW